MKWLSDTSDVGLRALQPKPVRKYVDIIGQQPALPEPTPVTPPTWVYVLAFAGLGWMIWRAVKPTRHYMIHSERDATLIHERDAYADQHG